METGAPYICSQGSVGLVKGGFEETSHGAEHLVPRSGLLPRRWSLEAFAEALLPTNSANQGLAVVVVVC